MGSIINKLDQANSLVSEMKSDIDDIIANSIGTPLSVYHEIGFTYGIYSVNENSFIGEIYNLLGVDNIANTIEDPYGSGYPVLEEEQVLASDPDLIVIGHSDYLNKDLSTRQGWENIKAVANDNVYFLDEMPSKLSLDSIISISGLQGGEALTISNNIHSNSENVGTYSSGSSNLLINDLNNSNIDYYFIIGRSRICRVSLSLVSYFLFM